jgi:hypothetical protein
VVIYNCNFINFNFSNLIAIEIYLFPTHSVIIFVIIKCSPSFKFLFCQWSHKVQYNAVTVL